VSTFSPRAAAPGLTLDPGEIHIWSISLDPPPDHAERYSRLLADDERARADRFRFDRHRRQYAVGRGALRTLLAAYLSTRPELISFSYGPRGKPFLAGPLAAGSGGLQFNLSNSDEMALVGFVRGVEIGVDIEFMKSMPDCVEISERFFSHSEREVLRSLPLEVREEAFFNCWTRKEAYLKAVGEGLAAPLDSFDVTLAPGEPPRMLTLEGDAARASRWVFRHFRPAEKYIGALAIEGAPPVGSEWAVSTWAMQP